MQTLREEGQALFSATHRAFFDQLKASYDLRRLMDSWEASSLGKTMLCVHTSQVNFGVPAARLIAAEYLTIIEDVLDAHGPQPGKGLTEPTQKYLQANQLTTVLLRKKRSRTWRSKGSWRAMLG